MTPLHLCLTCRFAEWKRTASGRLSKDVGGQCGWKPPHVPVPAIGNWQMMRFTRLKSVWKKGYHLDVAEDTISRRPDFPVTACETYEVKK